MRLEIPIVGVNAADAASGASPAPPGGAAWDWADLYARLGRGLISLAERRYGLAREDAEEALQRAATSIFLAAPSVRNPEAYLTTVFLRECLGTWRRLEDVRRHEKQLPENLQKADDACERIEVVCRFRRAFSLLSPYCRAVMRSCLLGGQTRVAADGNGAGPGQESRGSERSSYRRYRKCLRSLANALD